MTAAVLVGWLEVIADALHRSIWEGVPRATHVVAAVILLTAITTLLAGLSALFVAGYQAVERRLTRRFGSARWLAPVAGGVIAVASTASTAFWTFSGERVRGTPIATWGPWALIGILAFAGAGFAIALKALGRLLQGSRRRLSLALAAALLATACVLSHLDLTFYVSLYARLHTSLELSACVFATIAFLLSLSVAATKSPRAARATAWFATGAGAVALVFVFVEPLRRWVEDSLRHAWREPVYIGRMLSRTQIAEGFIRDPRGWRGATMSSVVKLRERYDIATTSRSAIWDAPLDEPAWLKDKLAKLRGVKDPNIIVFYVDTLRADVARDARVMPNTVRFASESLDFRRAYTTGSDTLHALPGITGGSFDLFSEQPNDILRVARGAGFRSVLTVAQSAHEFLSKMLPQFKFEETLEVQDYAAGNENVWGYGADQPTSSRIVDRTLDWLRQHEGQRFFLWMFNFDVHNWRELDEPYVRQRGKQYNLYDEADPIWRYRVVAHDVDVQFGRFLDGLRELGMDDDTVLLFLSDHGEGLGREGFWVHSVFLWESLIHVPLLLKVPGVSPAVVEDVVSLVDVAPTLARSMAPNADTAGYQGEDLLSYLVPGRPRRRLPLVLMSTLKEVPVRLGLIDPASPFKLVLPLEGAVPELYDIRASDPDAVDVSRDHEAEMLRLLNELVRAPLFPRLSEAGKAGALDQAALEGKTAIDKEAAASGAGK
ncbi:MAG TPA: sulfatase [Polyangiaceae bacterium]|nr:sulfatase [Polyangiaceae bacterium]